ncbi:type III secretion system chaperone [Bordetella genomosp. 1]|nr:type III secretion system chaperone [Bordetella genomosp. 1]
MSLPVPTAFSRMIDQIAAALGQPALPLSDDGICTLVVEDGLVLNLAAEPTGSLLVVFAQLGRIPAAGRLALYGRLLQANGAGAGPCVLGVNRAEDTALISARLPLEGLTMDVFEPWFTRVIEQALAWRTVVAAADAPVARAPAADADAVWLRA